MPGERRRGQLLYVYALAELGLPRRFAVRGRKLQTIDIGAVSAIVEPVNAVPPVTEDAVRRQHALVMRLAQRADALLPVRFGAAFTAAELEAHLKAAQGVLLTAFQRVRGCVQMTVRIQTPTIHEPAGAQPLSGTAYLTARSARARALRSAAARIRRAVSRLVVDQRIDEGKGELLGTVYHLIRSEDADRYRSGLEAVTSPLGPFRLLVTGPWPVFAFVPQLGGGGPGGSRTGGSRGRGSRG